jgi:hypothetical protein
MNIHPIGLNPFASIEFQMKIYFAGPIRGDGGKKEFCFELIRHIKRYGEVLSEHVGTSHGEYEKSHAEVYKRDMDWLMSADAVVAEVSLASTGTGIELGRIDTINWLSCFTPLLPRHHFDVLCLYDQNLNSVSPMAAGSPHLNATGYKDLDDAKRKIDDFMSKIQKANSTKPSYVL